ncbi:hypothetical protein QR680_006202 [Steinernema hermaphroditum]|uniref:Uncharacterized protein n=1 Tax=Steinernema hermaphroditum TaxID=289476 RepID=A0AA39HWW1_9BILA|nr:hypothetical protein QR680_006202 [Steinernema hermaphroditum]
MAFILCAVHVQDWIRIASMPFNLFIIVLSFTKVRSSLARTYALNISATMLLSAIFTYSYKALDALILKDTSCAIDQPTDIRPVCSAIIGATNAFLVYLSINIYYFQATLTVVIAYLKRPFRRTNSLFLLCYILTIYVALTEALDAYEVTDGFLRAAFSVVRQILQTVAIVAMIIFYCLKMANLSGSSKANWSCLRSILIYCTPPNLFLFISLPEVICLPLAYNFETVSMLQAICTHIDVLALIDFCPRLLVTSVSALIAFRDYREAILMLLRRFFGTIRSRNVELTTVLPMKSISP